MILVRLTSEKSRRRSLDERIVPMINIIFLLLLFFLLSGSMHELVSEDISPPYSTTGSAASGSQEHGLLSRDGTIVWLGEKMSLDSLSGALLQGAATSPETVSLRVDAAVQAAELIPFLEALESTGTRRVQLVTINEVAGD